MSKLEVITIPSVILLRSVLFSFWGYPVIVGQENFIFIVKLLLLFNNDRRSYGCGLPIPEAVEKCKILDLGCGTGRDVFVLSKLVGPNGKVVGIDMTQEQVR